MIDLHAHILPDMDDGSDDWRQSLEMARMALDGGVDTMIVTPHANLPGMFENYYDEKWQRCFEDFRQMLADYHLPLRVFPGMEVYGTDEVPMLLRDGRLLTLNNSRYMLIEFSFYEDPEWISELLGELRDMGVVPIIAHPERYTFVRDDPTVAYDWVRAGCLIQVNKGSLLGRFGRSAESMAHRLISHRLVHAVASDAHSHIERTPYMMDVFKYLSKTFSEDCARRLTKHIPLCILTDAPVEAPAPIPFESTDGEWGR